MGVSMAQDGNTNQFSHKAQLLTEASLSGGSPSESLRNFAKDHSKRLQKELEDLIVTQGLEDGMDAKNQRRFFDLKDYDHILRCPRTCSGGWHISDLPISKLTEEERKERQLDALGGLTIAQAIPELGLEKVKGILDSIEAEATGSSGPIICSECNQPLETTVGELKQEQYFTKTAEYAIRALIMTAAKSSELRRIDGFEITWDGETKPVSPGYILDPKRNSSADRALIENYLRLACEQREYLGISLPEIKVKDQEKTVQISAAGAERPERNFFVRQDEVVTTLQRLLLTKVRSEDQFEDEDEADAWTFSMASKVMFLLQTRIGEYEFIDYSRSHKPNKKSSKLLYLSNQFIEDLNGHFKNDEGDYWNDHPDFSFIGLDTPPPMLCQPRDWKPFGKEDCCQGIDSEEKIHQSVCNKSHSRLKCKCDDALCQSANYIGGFLSELAEQYPIVRGRETIYRKIGQHRFLPSAKSVNALNSLQKTRWTIDKRMPKIIKSVLAEAVNQRIQNRLEISTDKEGSFTANLISRAGDVPGLNQGKALPDWTSINEWSKEIRIAEIIVNEPGYDATFFHSWHLDWRGRLYSASQLLTPQGDDVSRGLIRFKESQKLTDEGWEYLGLYTAALWKGQNIEGAPQKKTRAALEQSLQDEKFLNELRDIAFNIVKNPLYRFKDWGANDVFAAKSEGFIRIAATLSFVDALQKGGPGAECNLPVVLDGSCNGYQHLAMLMRDQETAHHVNVLKREGSEEIADLYQTVADKVKITFEQSLRDKFDHFSEKEIDYLNQQLTKRSVAKMPVMTMGYGAGINGMIEALLTHNGKSIDQGGKSSKATDSKGKEIDCAHPMSHLGPILDLIDGPENDQKIARLVITQYKKAVEHTLPKYREMTNTLQKLISKQREPWLPEEYWQPDGWGMLSSWPVPDQPSSKWTDSDWETWKSGSSEQNTRWGSKEIHPPVPKKGEEENSHLWKWFNDTNLTMPEIEKFEEPRTKKQEARDRRIRWVRAIEIAKQHVEAPPNEPLLWKIKEQSPDADFGDVRVRELSLAPHRPSVEEPEFLRSRREEQRKEAFTRVAQNWEGLEIDTSILVDSSASRTDKEMMWREICKFANPNLTDDDIVLSRSSGKPVFATLRKIDPPQRTFIEEMMKTTVNVLTTSKKQIDPTKVSVGDEVKGITPNFVHSYDSTHMRMVITHLRKYQEDSGMPIQFWSVHDAFGTHPNGVQKLRDIVSEKFAKTHQDSSEHIPNTCFGPLDKSHFETFGKVSDTIQSGDLNIEDVKANSPYLVWF